MNSFLNIKLDYDTQLLCVSDIHEHHDQFFNILDHYPLSNSRKLIICGDVIDKGFGFESAEKIYNKIQELVNLNQAYIIKGNHELKNIKKQRKLGKLNKLFRWLDSLPISLSFIYPNSSRYTFVHGGVDPKMTWEQLAYDLTVCYIRYVSNETQKMVPIDKKEENGNVLYIPKDSNCTLWHECYDGRFGYIISGHNNNPEGPKFYNYSCNIDTGVFNSGKLTAVLFSSKGREEIYQAEGKAFNASK